MAYLAEELRAFLHDAILTLLGCNIIIDDIRLHADAFTYRWRAGTFYYFAYSLGENMIAGQQPPRARGIEEFIIADTSPFYKAVNAAGLEQEMADYWRRRYDYLFRILSDGDTMMLSYHAALAYGRRPWKTPPLFHRAIYSTYEQLLTDTRRLRTPPGL